MSEDVSDSYVRRCMVLHVLCISLFITCLGISSEYHLYECHLLSDLQCFPLSAHWAVRKMEKRRQLLSINFLSVFKGKTYLKKKKSLIS